MKPHPAEHSAESETGKLDTGFSKPNLITRLYTWYHDLVVFNLPPTMWSKFGIESDYTPEKKKSDDSYKPTFETLDHL